DRKITCVADEVGSGFARRAPCHVVAHDLVLFAATLDRGSLLVRARRTHGIVELDVVGLPATDRVLLLLGGQRIPLREVGHVALYGDVAAPGVLWVLIADDRPETALVALRILGAVHEADEVAIVHVSKAVWLGDDLDGGGGVVDEDGGQLVAEVGAIGANVEQ